MTSIYSLVSTFAIYKTGISLSRMSNFVFNLHLGLTFVFIPMITGILKNVCYQPFGPIMCRERCQTSPGCRSYWFSVHNLSCCLSNTLCSSEEIGQKMYCFNVYKEVNTSRKVGHGGNATFETGNNVDQEHQEARGNTVRMVFNTSRRMLICIRRTPTCHFRDLSPGYVGEMFSFETSIDVYQIGRFTNNDILLESEKDVVTFSLDYKKETVLVTDHFLLDVSNNKSDGNVFVLTKSRIDFHRKVLWRLTWPNRIFEIDNFTCAHRLVYVSKTDTLYISCYKNVRYLNLTSKTQGIFIKVEQNVKDIAADESRNTLYVVIRTELVKVNFADGTKFSSIFKKREIYEILFFNDSIYIEYCESYYFVMNTGHMVGVYNLANNKMTKYSFNKEGGELLAFPIYFS